ncbi:MAG: crossover junction endodeoxyribonuclease RuvC [Elusimicrobia bacterium]|nr:crossover junction endodeoxyribonuclease RuvC [Elusimicrobiota bacterium]
MIVLGVDPGIASCGWAIIEETKDKSASWRIKIKNCGVIKTKVKTPIGLRLCTINKELKEIIKNNKPDIAVVEELFFAKNVKTAITVGHARGVVCLTCTQMGLSIYEFTPLQIKQALTGYGQASKDQVGYMVKSIFKLKELPRDDNTVDAIATGVCFLHTNKSRI